MKYNGRSVGRGPSYLHFTARLSCQISDFQSSAVVSKLTKFPASCSHGKNGLKSRSKCKDGAISPYINLTTYSLNTRVYNNYGPQLNERLHCRPVWSKISGFPGFGSLFTDIWETSSTGIWPSQNLYLQKQHSEESQTRGGF
jgi:hypothetical protein